MITIDSGLNGYDQDGLNGLKIGSFIKRNVKSAKKDISIKNAVKVLKVAAPIGLSFIPIAGGTASKIGGKLLNGAGGKANLLGRAVSGVSGDGTKNLFGRTADFVKKGAKTKVGSSVIKLGAPLVKNAKTAALQKAGIIANDAQLETLAEAKGTSPQEELDNIAPVAKDNTMLYVGGGILALGLAYVAFKK